MGPGEIVLFGESSAARGWLAGRPQPVGPTARTVPASISTAPVADVVVGRLVPGSAGSAQALRSTRLQTRDGSFAGERAERRGAAASHPPISGCG